MKKTDKLIKEALMGMPKVNPEINRDLAERFAERSYARDTESEREFEISINQVERYKKPSVFKRMGALAAALAVVVAIGGGGAAAFRNMRSVDESSLTDTDDVTSETSVEESAETPEETVYPENSYDMTTKEGIYTKIINSVYFYDRVSATVVEHQAYKEGVCAVSDFQLDLTNGKAYGYMSRVNYENNLQDILKGEAVVGEEDNWISKGDFFGHIVTYCNGERLVWLRDNMQMYNVNANDSDISKGRTPEPVNYAQSRAYAAELAEKDSDEDLETTDPYENRSNGINTHLGTNCLRANCTMAGLELWDFDKWDIVGDVEFIGRECVEIAFNTMDSTMYIDKETGCMLYYTYYVNGDITEYLVVDEIRFNEEAEPVPEIDLSQYKESDEPTPEEVYAYRENSRGETYGICGQYHICEQNDEILPDLISVGEDGYVKKSELFEKAGCESRTNKLRQEDKKLDTDTVVVCTLNVYDAEGENVIDVIKYYGSEADKEEFETAVKNPCTDSSHKNEKFIPGVDE